MSTYFSAYKIDIAKIWEHVSRMSQAISFNSVIFVLLAVTMWFSNPLVCISYILFFFVAII